MATSSFQLDAKTLVLQAVPRVVQNVAWHCVGPRAIKRLVATRHKICPSASPLDVWQACKAATYAGMRDTG